jgi:hypothetical protein
MMTQENTRFGLANSFDLYRKLRHDAKALLRERPETDEEKIIEEYEAFNFFVTAWHLHKDWLGNATISKPEHSCEKINIAHPALKEVRHAMRDIANGSKHITLTEKPKISVGAREISSFDSYFFGAQYPIETKTHHFLMNEFVYLILEYFEWIFDDNAPKIVPESILEKLKTAKALRIARDNITAAGLPNS